MLIKHPTGECIPFYFRKVERAEIQQKQYNESNGWQFDWVHPFTRGYEVYALVTEEYPDDVQGLIAIIQNTDPDYNCVEIEIVESAPQNKKLKEGRLNIGRRYLGTGKCLIAFACQYSINHDFDGYVGLTSKSSKFKFYEDMGAFRTAGQRYMFFDTTAKQLVQTYFPGGVKWWER